MWDKPLPNIDRDNRPLFEAFQNHEFVLWRCQKCGEWYFWKTYCKDHSNEPHFGDLELEEASGDGEVFATSTTHRLFHPGFKNDLPYDYSLIKLDEGPIISTQVQDMDPTNVEVGIPIEIVFKDIPKQEIPEEKQQWLPLEDGFTLPYASPVEEVH